jgi:ABC-type nitrate/sulfonate/bicarbonate transport system permease component
MSSTSKLAASVVPPPQNVLLALWAQLQSGALIIDLSSSLGRANLGYAVSALIGIPLGLAMGTNPTLRGLLSAPVELLGPVSSIAWIPLAILWFGIGLTSVVFVTFIVCIFIILLNTLAAVMVVELCSVSGSIERRLALNLFSTP